jgi:hypothetical protein
MGNTYVLANLTNGTITLRGGDNTADSIEDYGNGWYRITLTGTAIATGTTALIFRLGANPTGDGTSGFYLWGAQFEEGAYPTSYIPTDGTTVTRVQDQYSKTGISDLINSEEGTFFVEMAAFISLDTLNRSISLSDGSTSNRIMIQFPNALNKITGYMSIGGSHGVFDEDTTSSTTTNFNKIAIKWKAGTNETALWVNGSPIATDTVTMAGAGTFNQIVFTNGASSSPLYAKAKQIQIYKTALTDPELVTLTT